MVIDFYILIIRYGKGECQSGQGGQAGRHKVLEGGGKVKKKGIERYRLTVRGTGKVSLRAALAEAVWRRYLAER